MKTQVITSPTIIKRGKNKNLSPQKDGEKSKEKPKDKFKF